MAATHCSMTPLCTVIVCDTLTPKPRRGYLLVTHATAVCGDIIDTFGAATTNAELDGEATLIDIVNGEAWGYKQC